MSWAIFLDRDGLINELALWWVEERPLPKEEMVRQATRMVRAVCDSEG